MMLKKKNGNPFSSRNQRRTLLKPQKSEQLTKRTMFLLVLVALGFIVQGLVKAIRYRGENQQYRGRRFQKFNSLKSSIKSSITTRLSRLLSRHSSEYMSQEEQDGRPLRFPSVEDRVKLYMSNWYAPPCTDDEKIQYNYQLSDRETSKTPLYVREASSKVAPKKRLLELHSSPHTSDSKVFYMNDQTLGHCKQETCSDVMQYLYPYSPYSTPVLLDIGDKHTPIAYLPEMSQDGWYPAVPHFKKYRLAYAKSEVTEITTPICFKGVRDDRLEQKTVLKVKFAQPIIWKLKVERHFGKLGDVAALDIPYKKKKDLAVFRGRLSGLHKLTSEEQTDLPDREKCLKIPRCQVVLTHAKSRLVDAKLVGPTKGMSTVIEGDYEDPNSESVRIFADGNMKLAEMLHYKMIIMMEGNDVSAGLKWALYSNSVVLIDSISYTSWAMEERLRPWIHYVPFDADTLEERVKWVLDNPIGAERIARNGALWIKDMLFHPQAAKDEDLIYREMMRRYEAHFTINPNLL